MTQKKRLRTINSVLLIALGFLTLERLLCGQSQGAFDHTPTRELQQVKDDSSFTNRATIGKLFMQYGPSDPMYERALATHLPHNAQHNYPMYILRRQTVKHLWSKPAYMLQHLLMELEKPEAERLKWLFWFDSDIILLNPHIPLDVFLPPQTKSKQWDHIHALVCQDNHGLNTGVFALKVTSPSAMLMAAALSTRESLPHLKLKYNDQSAMEYWLQSDLFRNGTIHVPQRWFNAYPGTRGTNGIFSDPDLPQRKWRANYVQEGDLAVHFAGDSAHRAPRMLPWLDVAEQRQVRWEVPFNRTGGLVEEVKRFWKSDAPQEWERVQKFREACGYQYA